jgi:hypothetical protein
MAVNSTELQQVQLVIPAGKLKNCTACGKLQQAHRRHKNYCCLLNAFSLQYINLPHSVAALYEEFP